MKDTTQAASNCENCSRSFTLTELREWMITIQKDLTDAVPAGIQFRMGARAAFSLLAAQLQTMPGTAALEEDTSQASQGVQSSMAANARANTPNDIYAGDIHADAALSIARNGYRLLGQHSNIKRVPSKEDIPLAAFANWVSANLQTLVMEQQSEITKLHEQLDIATRRKSTDALAAKNQELAVAKQKLEKGRIAQDRTHAKLHKTRKILATLGIQYAATSQTYIIQEPNKVVYNKKLVEAIELHNKSVDSPEKP